MQNVPDELTITPEVRQLAVAYPAEQALARKAGIPLTVRELKRLMPPEAENAAPLYRRLSGVHETSKEETALFEFLAKPSPTAADIAEAERTRARCEAVYAIITQAVRRPKCVFDRDLDIDDPTKLLMPELTEMRRCARLLTVNALLTAYRGNGPAAVGLVASCFQIARHTESNDFLIGWLVGRAVDAIALSGMGRLLNIHPDGATVEAVRQVLNRSRKLLPLRPALAAEAAYDQSALTAARKVGYVAYMKSTAAEGGEEEAGFRRHWEETERKAAGMDPVTRRANEKALFDASAAVLLRCMRKLCAAADLPYPQAAHIFRTVQGQAIVSPTSDNKAGRLPLPALLLPVFENLPEQKARIEAQAATLRAGATVLAYRASNKGRLPDSLPGLFPDPFTGKQLGYRKEPGAKGTGFVIYSVGADGKFDGGRPGNPVPAKSRTLLFRFAP